MVMTCPAQTSQAGVELSGLEDPINWAMGLDWAPLSTKGAGGVVKFPLSNPLPCGCVS